MHMIWRLIFFFNSECSLSLTHHQMVRTFSFILALLGAVVFIPYLTQYTAFAADTFDRPVRAISVTKMI